MPISSNDVPESDEPSAADSGPQRPVKQEPFLLESDVPLSGSLIWRLQREFYEQRGLKAWIEDQVPSFITNNPFIAEIYAGIVFHFLCECMELGRRESRLLSPQNPLRILELGGGSGKFSYLFLRHLTALLSAKDIPLATVRYCMTDCSESIVQSWDKNSYFSKFVEQGVLEFERLEAGQEIKSPFVAGSGRRASGAASGPLVLIANYVFDSLPQDAFMVKDGEISEVLATTISPSRSRGENAALSSLKLSYKNVKVSPRRYADPSWNEILELYRTRLPAATVLFPSQALQTLQELGTCTDGGMLVLAADKGHTHEDQLLLCQGPPALEFHAPNCFSQMVNFDAVGKYFTAIGGEALLPDKHSAGLSICGFLQRRPGDRFAATKTAYQKAQEGFGPDDLFALLGWLNAHMEEMSVPQILATLRLTRWDPAALVRLYPVLACQLRKVYAERQDLRNAVLRTWANHYPIHPSENVLAFNCGVILLELRFFADALQMFKVSQQIFGTSAATSYNLGLCAVGLGRHPEALAFMVEACNLDPQFEPARLSRLKLEKEIGDSDPQPGNRV